MAFYKKSGLRIEDMVRSRWVYRKLRNFRAGIEADISRLKRAYGLARCTWSGLDHFRAYVWSAVVAYNLALFARLKPASRPPLAAPRLTATRRPIALFALLRSNRSAAVPTHQVDNTPPQHHPSARAARYSFRKTTVYGWALV
jgi:IS5 family transposase